METPRFKPTDPRLTASPAAPRPPLRLGCRQRGKQYARPRSSSRLNLRAYALSYLLPRWAPVRPAVEHAILRRKWYCVSPRPITVTSARCPSQLPRPSLACRLQPWVRVRSRVVSRLLQRYALVTSRSAAAGPATSQAHPLGSRGMDTVEKTG